MIGRWIALLLVASLAGCAAEPPAPPPPAPPDVTAAAPPAPIGPPKPWDTMSFDERYQHMTEHVLPVMAAKFKAFDAEKYATFGCQTCHGDDMVERKFAMPNPSLPLLPAPRTPEWEAMRTAPGVATFMWQDVWPTMIQMLGSTPLNPATRQGFGCTGCHLHTPAPAPAPAPTEEKH